MRPFLPSEVQQIRRIVEAIVPMQCSVQAISVNQGWKVTLVICGRVSCHSYELQPPMNREAVVRIAEAWETGVYQPTADTPKAVERMPWANNAGDLLAWARAAHHGQKIGYFDGSVAHFRHEANTKLRKLQSQSDKRTGKTKHWGKKSAIIDRVQAQIELLNSVERLRQGDVIDLVQQRKPDGSGAIYYAVRK